MQATRQAATVGPAVPALLPMCLFLSTNRNRKPGLTCSQPVEGPWTQEERQ